MKGRFTSNIKRGNIPFTCLYFCILGFVVLLGEYSTIIHEQVPSGVECGFKGDGTQGEMRPFQELSHQFP